MHGGWAARIAACLLLAGLHGTAVWADIYAFRDRRGWHFSNAPTDPQYQYYMPDLSGWRRSARAGRIDGARRKRYDRVIADAADRHRVDVALVKAVIRAESDFQPDVVSPKGALGLMQLMPATARMHNIWHTLEPEDNVEGGVRHLRYLLDRYAGNVRLALAAYNAGEGAVERNGGVPPFPETWDYLSRVIQFRDAYARERPPVRVTR